MCLPQEGVGWAAVAAARGGCLLPQGACPAGMHPPFSFPSCGKENGPCTVQKKRPLGALRCSGPPRATGVGVSVPAPIWAGLRARLGLLRFLQLPSRGGWRSGHRGARTHLISSSFRAFRFATRCPGGRRGCCVGPCCSFHQQPASGSEKRSKSMRRPPRRSQQYWHGTAVPTSQKAIACPKASPNRRLHRYVDPRARGGPLHRSAPKRPFLLDRARPVFFSAKTEKKMGGASPLDKPPCGSRYPRGRRPAAHLSPGGGSPPLTAPWRWGSTRRARRTAPACPRAPAAPPGSESSPRPGR